MITIVNYGLGNIQAIATIYRRLGMPVRIASSAAELAGATKIILPGVGAFDWAMTLLNESGMREPLDEMVRNGGCPVVGVCVGMQMMANGSEEGDLPGLGWIEGHVRKLESLTEKKQPLPHMGWNDVRPLFFDSLFKGFDNAARFYFLHSYHVIPANHDAALVLSDYCGEFVAGIAAANVFGVQFHPEKSHQWGVELLKNFGEL